MLLPEDYVVWLKDVRYEDKKDCGLELASLGELAQHAVPTTKTIVITPHAFNYFLETANLRLQIKHLLGTLNYDRHDSVVQVGNYLQKIINHAQVPRQIYENLFRLYEKEKLKEVSLEAYYFRDGAEIGKHMWVGIEGEAVLIEKIRNAWAHLFTSENLTTHDIHHKNHHTFSVCIAIRQTAAYEYSGIVRTDTKKARGEYEIRVHSEDSNPLSAKDIESLLAYAKVCDRNIPHSQILHFVKNTSDLHVTAVVPVSDAISYDGTYVRFLEGESLHPGITIGRLRLVESNKKAIDISHDEILFVDKVDKNFASTLRKARGLIFENDIDPEVAFILKSAGIPTIIHGKKLKNKFMQGDVISLNAATGEVKRGSMLV